MFHLRLDERINSFILIFVTTGQREKKKDKEEEKNKDVDAIVKGR